MFQLDVESSRAEPHTRPGARPPGGHVRLSELTDLSYPQIGKEFGGRDHTTVIHAYDKIANLMQERRKTYEDVTSLDPADPLRRMSAQPLGRMSHPHPHPSGPRCCGPTCHPGDERWVATATGAGVALWVRTTARTPCAQTRVEFHACAVHKPATVWTTGGPSAGLR